MWGRGSVPTLVGRGRELGARRLVVAAVDGDEHGPAAGDDGAVGRRRRARRSCRSCGRGARSPGHGTTAAGAAASAVRSGSVSSPVNAACWMTPSTNPNTSSNSAATMPPWTRAGAPSWAARRVTSASISSPCRCTSRSRPHGLAGPEIGRSSYAGASRPCRHPLLPPLAERDADHGTAPGRRSRRAVNASSVPRNVGEQVGLDVVTDERVPEIAHGPAGARPQDVVLIIHRGEGRRRLSLSSRRGAPPNPSPSGSLALARLADLRSLVSSGGGWSSAWSSVFQASVAHLMRTGNFTTPCSASRSPSGTASPARRRRLVAVGSSVDRHHPLEPAHERRAPRRRCGP